MSDRSYDVTIQAVITKTIRVEADTVDESYELAHELFDARFQDDYPERYEETTLNTVEVKT